MTTQTIIALDIEARAQKLYAQYLAAGGIGVLAPLDYWREFARECPCTEDEAEEFPATSAAGHALLTERRRGKTRVHCECGEQFGRGNPATSLDSAGRAWGHHLKTEESPMTTATLTEDQATADAWKALKAAGFTGPFRSRDDRSVSVGSCDFRYTSGEIVTLVTAASSEPSVLAEIAAALQTLPGIRLVDPKPPWLVFAHRSVEG